MFQNKFVLFIFALYKISQSQSNGATYAIDGDNEPKRDTNKKTTLNDNLIRKKRKLHRVMMTARCVLYINPSVLRLDRFFNLTLVRFFLFFVSFFLSMYFFFFCDESDDDDDHVCSRIIRILKHISFFFFANLFLIL